MSFLPLSDSACSMSSAASRPAQKYFAEQPNVIFYLVETRWYYLGELARYDAGTDLTPPPQPKVLVSRDPLSLFRLGQEQEFWMMNDEIIRFLGSPSVLTAVRLASVVATAKLPQHWYVRLRNTTTGEEFDLEYSPTGVKKSPDAAEDKPGRPTVHVG